MGEFRVTGDDITEEEARLLEAHGPLEMTRIIIRLTKQLKEAEAVKEAARFAHRTLVEQKVARIIREDARAGGLADMISAVVNKLRSTLSKD